MASGSIDARSSLSYVEYEELQAVLMLHTCFVWHGGAEQRAAGRANSKKVFRWARQLGLLDLAGPDQPSRYSYLHHLAPGDVVEPWKWQRDAWLVRERWSGVMFSIFLLDAALCVYFNCAPELDLMEIRLPLPCDDAVWEAADAHSCVNALGLHGADIQVAGNVSGSLRSKQPELPEVLSALRDVSVVLPPRATNVFSKFILIHALHVQLWHVQRRHSQSPVTGPPV